MIAIENGDIWMKLERNMANFFEKKHLKKGVPQIILKTVRVRAFCEHFASYHPSLSVIVSEIWPIFGMPKISKKIELFKLLL